MRYTTDLLYRLVNAIGSGDATPDVVTVELPPVLVPTLSLSGPIPDSTGVTATEIQRETFRQQLITTRAASSTALNVAVATFGRGLWRISWSATFVASFTQAFDSGTPQFKFTTRNPAFLTDLAFWSAMAVANVPQTESGELNILFPVDSWQLFTQHAATGVGQTAMSAVGILAHRLT